jgi:hypothetical protein
VPEPYFTMPVPPSLTRSQVASDVLDLSGLEGPDEVFTWWNTCACR